MSSDRSVPLLVLGLGNVLCGDDGLGVVAVHLLQRRYQPPEGVSVLDGGTLGLSLLPHLEEAGQAILVDAVRTGGPPGSLVRLEGDGVAPAVAARLSVHQVGVVDLLDGAHWRERYPSRLVLLGLVPQTLELGLERSGPVEAALPSLIERIVAEARDMGHTFSTRAGDEGALRGLGDLAHVYGL